VKKDFDLLHVRIVGFSGQQTLRNPSAVAASLRGQLEALHSPGKHLMALSPLGGPADLIFAKEALDLGIPLVLILAQPPEELGKLFADQPAAELDHVLQKATKIEPVFLNTAVEVATLIGHKLVDETDVILALSDDTQTANAGDTAEVIAYAARRGRPVICLRETADGITVSEIKPDATPDQPQQSIDQLEDVLGVAPEHPSLPDGLVKYFHACDTHATNTAPKVRRYALNIVLANAIASIAGSVSSSFPHSPAIGITLTVVKFGGILLGLIIFAVLSHRQSRNRWLTLRLKAEVCRSAMATWYSPVAIEPLTSDEVPELHQLMQALRYFRATHPQHQGEISMDGFKAAYGKRRLIDQYRYFERQAKSAANISSRCSPIYWVLSGSALLISGFTLFLPAHYWSFAPAGRLMNFIMIMVPVVAPALASWIIAWQAIESVSRKRARFVEMQRLMHQALVDLIHCHSWEAVQHVVKRAERQLLTEVLEWYSFVKYSG